MTTLSLNSCPTRSQHQCRASAAILASTVLMNGTTLANLVAVGVKHTAGYFQLRKSLPHRGAANSVCFGIFVRELTHFFLDYKYIPAYKGSSLNCTTLRLYLLQFSENI